MVTGPVKTWLEKNLWAILAAGATLWSGYLTGQVMTREALTNLARRMDRVERQVTDQRPFMVCTVRTLDSIKSKVQSREPCTLDVPE